jgi:tetratricopeptide (TPR) repeat protein
MDETESVPTTAGEPLDHGGEQWIGPYRLLHRIGEGGFGTVFLAEQRVPMVRRVALKIIKRGMDTRQVIARFEAERQALAMMDHPNIATVLDAGATRDGRPFFVMELVHGDPVTEYCDRETLPTRARLNLFVQVCHAVQHAHQKGIIHRDLKPGNVLVAVVDGTPVPKVIDFGIAKATTVPLTEKTVVTERHQVIGTPEYMSPEQAEMTGIDVDTRSDIYSLGVLLYELLTGTTPVERRRLREAGWAGIPRMIREVDPPTPSTRLREVLAAQPQIAERRASDPSRLAASVRGDLDWIVMKCIEKDRTRRYDTANALAADVARHLAGEPVLAAPPSAAYRVQKFVTRNKTAVGAALLTVLLLVAGIAGTTYGLLRAQAGRREAERQRVEADAQTKTAEQVLAVYQDMLHGVKAEVARGRDTALLKEILDKTRTRIEAGEFKERAAAELALRSTLGLAYLDLGDQATAERILSAALQLAREKSVGDLAHLPEATTNLAGVFFESGRVRDAEQHFKAALDLYRRRHSGDHQDVANALSNEASMLEQLGRFAEAETLHREALSMRERLFKGDHADIAMSKANLAFALQQIGKFEEAERLHRDALAMRQRVYVSPHLQIAVSQNNLAMLLGTLGRDEEAAVLYRDALAIRQQLYKGDHLSVASGLANFGFAKNRLGDFAGAEELFREALEMRRRLFKGDHPDIVVNLDNLGMALRLEGRPKEAEPFTREALAMGQRVFRGDHPSLALTTSNLANILLALGKPASAELLARDALAMARRLFKADHAYTARLLDTLANTLLAERNWTEAEKAARDALEMRQRLFHGDHRDVAQSLDTLARVLNESGRKAEALKMAEQSVAVGQRSLPPGHPMRNEYEQNLARIPRGR